MKTLLNKHEIDILAAWAHGSKMPEFTNIDWVLSTACREYLEVLRRPIVDAIKLEETLYTLKEGIEKAEETGSPINATDVVDIMLRWVEEHKL